MTSLREKSYHATVKVWLGSPLRNTLLSHPCKRMGKDPTQSLLCPWPRALQPHPVCTHAQSWQIHIHIHFDSYEFANSGCQEAGETNCRDCNALLCSAHRVCDGRSCPIQKPLVGQEAHWHLFSDVKLFPHTSLQRKPQNITPDPASPGQTQQLHP